MSPVMFGGFNREGKQVYTNIPNVGSMLGD
jgi:hypothetical protein